MVGRLVVYPINWQLQPHSYGFRILAYSQSKKAVRQDTSQFQVLFTKTQHILKKIWKRWCYSRSHSAYVYNIHESECQSMTWAQIHLSPPRTRLELVCSFRWRPGALLRDAAEPAWWPSPSPFIRSLLCGIIGPNHFWLWDDAVFILRESIPVEQVLLQWFRAVQVYVVLLKDVLEQLCPLCEAAEQVQTCEMNYQLSRDPGAHRTAGET